jgi:glycosyltransferase involved in cell wall biosynthesis
VVRRAAAVIYLNDNELTNSAMLRVNPKAIVIPNGCYISNIKAEPVETAGPGKVEILFLGRIDVNHKGLDLLLPAVKKLYNGDMRDKIHFSFYGSGEDSDTAWLKKEVAGMEGFADFYGPVYGEAKNRVYQNSDLMVLTSRYEGFPMVILESLSHGTPCLVTPDTNVADIMQENDCGWVAEFDSDKIADTLNYAISDIEARKDLIRSNALNTGLQYKWNHIAEISIDRYKEILKNSHSI